VIPRRILGIETSCDETAAAIVIDGKPVADRTTTQVLHEQYGGVVPELASRAHERLLMPAVEGVLRDAHLTVEDIDGIAVTFGPGLAGALLVGVAFAKGLAMARNIPVWGINHLEGHLWSGGLTTGAPPQPFLALLISGGHTLLVEVEGFGRYRRIGTTRDDAAGELFDKVGRMLGFRFPAGARIDAAALEFKGIPIAFPRTRIDGDPTGFSFSGLKTAVLYYLQRNFKRDVDSSFILTDEVRNAICAGLMSAVGGTLAAAIRAALDQRRYQALVVAGGVSASRYLRGIFEGVTEEAGIPLIIPPIQHCTDNGLMIAYAGYLRMSNGYPASDLNFTVDPAASLFASSSIE